MGPQLAASMESIQARSSVTRAYTPGMEVEQLLLPHETMPTRVQAPSFWHTSGPPESPCGQRGEAGGRGEGKRGWGRGWGPVATYHAGGGSVSAGAHHHVVDAEPPVLLALRVGQQGQGHLLQHRRRRVGCGRAGGRQHPHGPRGRDREGSGDGDGAAVPEASVSPQPVVTQVRPPGKSSVAWGRQTGDTRAFSCAGVASLISVMSLRTVSEL